MTFVLGSYQAIERQRVGQQSAGHRASLAVLWRGEDLRTRSDVAMTVLPAECAAGAVVQVESVVAIDHPHVLPVIEVVTDGERVALVSPWPAGGRLSELIGRRGTLSVGETLTVLIPLASALAMAHAAGIRHGGICPQEVWFDTRGRPLLGATAVSRLITELNGGMPASSRDVAPEVVRGERLRGGSGLTVAADIFSMGSVALFCLTGRSAWPADDPADVLIQSAAGLWPDLPDEVGPAGLVELIRAMLVSEPESRPTAQEVATRLARVGDPAPVVFTSGPAPASASTDRWRGWNVAGTGLVEAGADAGRRASTGRPAASGRPASNRRQAHNDGQASTDGQDLDAELDSDADKGSTDEGFDPADRGALRNLLLHPHSARPVDAAPATPITPLRRAGIALLVGLLITVVAVQIGGWSSGWDRPDSSASALAPATGSWPEVVAGLDAARGQALAAADPGLLSGVYADAASSASAADTATIAQLASKGWRVVDGVHQIVSVTLDPPEQVDNPADNGTVRLAVVDALPARTIVDSAGEQVGLTIARAEQRRILVLSPTADGYRIVAVEQG